MKDGQIKRSGLREEQTIGVLREQEAGVTTAEVYRRHGVSSVSFSNENQGRRARCVGSSAAEDVDDESGRLRRMLDNVALKGLWW